MILFVQYRPGCKLQHNNNNDVHNSNFKCILTTFLTTKSVQICQKVVTEKTVTNLNLNFKFLFNVKFGSWAFRNCAYFVMEPSGCDTIRLGVQLNPYYGRVFSWSLSPGAHVPDFAKFASQRPFMAGQSSFFCSGASIRWYGTRTNRQKHTTTDHGGYRFEKVTKIR